MKRVLCLILSIFLLMGCVLPVFAADGVPAPVMEATKSVVRILSEYPKSSATGSGFVIKNEPGEVLIVTNDHVVEGNPSKISVWVSESRLVEAEIVFTTSERDLCVLKLNGTVDMNPLKLSREEPQHGAAIYAVGFPGAGDILSDTKAHTSDSATITDGIISAIRTFTIEKGGRSVKLLQVNAAINSGNSGGPLFNTAGEVIGINTYKVNAESQGIFGSVAVSELWDLLEQYNIEIPEEEPEPEIKEESEYDPLWIIGAAGAVLLLIIVRIVTRRKKKASVRRRRKANHCSHGVTLTDYLRNYPDGLGVNGAVSLLLNAAIELRNLHNDGRLHLQICPENIQIIGNTTSLKEPTGQEPARFNSGFAAPEIYKGAGFGIASDVYSFGAVLYYAATGRVPSNSLQQELLEQDFAFLPEEGFAAVIRKAMAFETFSRTQSMQELIYGISAFNSPSRVAPAKVPEAVMKKAEIEEKQEVPVPARQQVEPSKPVVTTVPEKKPEPVQKTEQKRPKEKKPAPKKKSRKWIPVTLVLGLTCAAAILLTQKEEPVSLLEKPSASAETTEAVQLSPEAVKYNEAVDLFNNGEYGKAAIAFGKLGDYRDAREISFKIWDAIADRKTIAASRGVTLAVREDGTVASCGRYAVPDFDTWEDIISLTADISNTVHTAFLALKSDGTVISVQGLTLDWTDIIGVYSVIIHEYDQYYTEYPLFLGLKSDGTIVAAHPYNYHFRDESYHNKYYNKILEYQKKFENLKDVVSIHENGNIIEFADGTFLRDFEVYEDPDLIYSSSYRIGSALLKKDGTVTFEIDSDTWQKTDQKITDKIISDIRSWTDIVAIAGSGKQELFGIKSDGTVVATGNNDGARPLDVGKWTDVVAVASSDCHAIGLRSDGTVVTSGNSALGERRTSDFKNIRLPADRDALLAAIELDYITDSEDDASAQPDTEEKPAVDISENILMGRLDIIREGNNTVGSIPNLPLFRTDVKRKEVRSITFLDTTKNAPADAADASALGNGKVKAWAEKNGDLYDVYVAAEGGVLAPEDSSQLFARMPNLTSINFGDAFDTSQVVDMGVMFEHCEKLINLDLSCFDTSNVTDMIGLFRCCTRLESVNVSSFDTKKVTTMAYMFDSCKNLETLDLAGFNTSNVTNTACMFLQCNKLRDLDLSSLDMSNVTDTFNMFYKCPAERPEWYNYTMD